MDTPYNQGLWRLLRWSHSKASQQCLQMPPLHCREGDPLAFSNKDKAKILAEKLFPAPSEVDLSDLPNGPAPAATLDIPPDISPKLLQQTISRLPSGKVAGPDSIPNEVLKQLVGPDLLKDLMHAVTLLLNLGTIPKAFNKTITAIICKEGKKDYTLPGSYRPIALKNLLAKLVEKIVTDRITAAAEEHNLLP